VEHLVMTHLDISYPEVPIKVCVGYTLRGKAVEYRPDQEYLNKVKPEYIELPSWSMEAVHKARKPKDLPKEALQYIAFISQALKAQPFMVTLGPKREQGIRYF
jgi:adenylosuccinate synthase